MSRHLRQFKKDLSQTGGFLLGIPHRSSLRPKPNSAFGSTYRPESWKPGFTRRARLSVFALRDSRRAPPDLLRSYRFICFLLESFYLALISESKKHLLPSRTKPSSLVGEGVDMATLLPYPPSFSFSAMLR